MKDNKDEEKTLFQAIDAVDDKFLMETLNSYTTSNIILNLNKRIMYMLNEARKAQVPLLISPTILLSTFTLLEKSGSVLYSLVPFILVRYKKSPF